MKEVVLPKDDIIVSKTDCSSHITYGNQLFIDISGYPERELIGQPHNVIRHPDMPRAIFGLLWQTLKSEKEFLGLVKNRCKNGDFYWAFANITPSYDFRSSVVGYYSVRRKPPVSMIEILEPVYQYMLKLEQSSSDKAEGMSHSKDYFWDEISKFGKDYDDALLSLFNGEI